MRAANPQSRVGTHDFTLSPVRRARIHEKLYARHATWGQATTQPLAGADRAPPDCRRHSFPR